MIKRGNSKARYRGIMCVFIMVCLVPLYSYAERNRISSEDANNLLRFSCGFSSRIPYLNNSVVSESYPLASFVGQKHVPWSQFRSFDLYPHIALTLKRALTFDISCPLTISSHRVKSLASSGNSTTFVLNSFTPGVRVGHSIYFLDFVLNCGFGFVTYGYGKQGDTGPKKKFDFTWHVGFDCAATYISDPIFITLGFDTDLSPEKYVMESYGKTSKTVPRDLFRMETARVSFSLMEVLNDKVGIGVLCETGWDYDIYDDLVTGFPYKTTASFGIQCMFTLGGFSTSATLLYNTGNCDHSVLYLSQGGFQWKF